MGADVVDGDDAAASTAIREDLLGRWRWRRAVEVESDDDATGLD